MRVTNTMMMNNMLRNLTRNMSRMENMQQQMASGKKFSRPSDDPIGVSRSLRLNTEVAAMEQYKRNADDVQSWLSTTEMAISNIGTILQRAKELTVQAASETNSIDERNAIASEIHELRNQLVQTGNTTYAGSYIFSGYKTDKPLFDLNGIYDLGGTGVSLTADEVIEVNVGLGDRMGFNSVGQKIFGLYDGVGDLDVMTANTLNNQQSLKSNYINATAADPIIIPAPSRTLQISYAGGGYTPITVAGGTYNNLTDLANAVDAGIAGAPPPMGGNITVTAVDNKLVFQSDSAEFSVRSGTLTAATLGLNESQASVSRIDSGNESQLIKIFDQLVLDLKGNITSGISGAIARINNQITNVNAVRAEIGVKTNRAELTINRILDDTLNLEGLLSKNEDADMAEVIMNIQMEENVYKASLSTGAKIIQPSLIDFLR